MANFTFSCPECGQHLEAQDEWRGIFQLHYSFLSPTLIF